LDDRGGARRHEEGAAREVPDEECSTADDEYVEHALRNYERFHGLPAGTATVDQLQASSAGIDGWAAETCDAAAQAHRTRRQRSEQGGLGASRASSQTEHSILSREAPIEARPVLQHVPPSPSSSSNYSLTAGGAAQALARRDQGSAISVGQPHMNKIRWDKVKKSVAGGDVKKDQTDGTLLPSQRDNRSGTASPSKAKFELSDVVHAAAVRQNLACAKTLSKSGSKAAQAQEANLQQANEGEKKGTIWHAVKYADGKDPAKRKEGRDSWEAIQSKLDSKTGKAFEEISEEVRKRGIFGETILHQAVLFARNPEDGNFEDHFWLVKELWTRFPEFRTAQYNVPELVTLLGYFWRRI
jgi:hypothetical protein